MFVHLQLSGIGWISKVLVQLLIKNSFLSFHTELSAFFLMVFSIYSNMGCHKDVGCKQCLCLLLGRYRLVPAWKVSLRVSHLMLSIPISSCWGTTTILIAVCHRMQRWYPQHFYMDFSLRRMKKREYSTEFALSTRLNYRIPSSHSKSRFKYKIWNQDAEVISNNKAQIKVFYLFPCRHQLQNKLKISLSHE